MDKDSILALAALLTVAVQAVLAITTLVHVLRTKGAVAATDAKVDAVNTNMDGRFSQLLDLIGRLAGTPDRRSTDRPS